MVTPVRTVQQAIDAFADEHVVPAAAIVAARLADHLEPSLPPRYRRLAADVFLRLPDGWDSHAHWTMGAGELEARGGDVPLAGAQLLTDEPAIFTLVEPGSGDTARWAVSLLPEMDNLQRWKVTLVPRTLEPYSDAAVRRVIAHELAHVASGLPSNKWRRDDMLCEDRADHLADLWGFQQERAALEAEEAAR